MGERAVVALTRAGRYTRARDTGDALLARRPPLDVFARLQCVLGDALWHLDDVHELTRRTTTALAAVTDPVVRARLTARQALARSRGATSWPPARPANGRSRRRSGPVTGGPRPRPVGLGEIALNAGDCAAAVAHHTALSVFDSAFLPEEAVALIHADDFDAVGRLLRTAGEAPLRPAMLIWAQGTLNTALGRLDDADADFVTAERLEADLRVPGNLVNIRVNRGLLAMLRGDREAAREHLDVVRTTVADRPNTGNHATHRYFEAVMADADGDHAAAAGLLRSAQRDHPSSGGGCCAARRPGRAHRPARRGPELAEDLAAQAAAHADRNPAVPTARGRPPTRPPS
ncbi:hypothetical protein O1L60_34455 [Streptomyces diastatochromogenes]|nr:hypothetical protein [Streptomyces diastatochromogenes]